MHKVRCRQCPTKRRQRYHLCRPTKNIAIKVFKFSFIRIHLWKNSFYLCSQKTNNFTNGDILTFIRITFFIFHFIFFQATITNNHTMWYAN